MLNQNYFPYSPEYNNQNNFLIYNDPILSARKRIREEYSNFSPLYRANLKGFTPLLSLNSPGVPSFFLFNNAGQSMTTTPVPFKIQNNVMLTSFFTPQNNNQNLNINNNNNSIYLNKDQINQAKVCPINFKSEEKDDNSTIKDPSMPESSGTDKSSIIICF